MYCASTIRLGHAGRTSTRCELWNSAYARMNFLPIHQAMLHNLFTKYVRLCECLYVRKVIENREILSACMRVNERRWRRSSNHVQTGVTHVKHIPNGITVLVYWCNRTTIKNTHFYTQTVLAHTHHIWHGLWFYFLIFLAFSFLGLPSFKLTYMMWYDVRTCLCLL